MSEPPVLFHNAVIHTLCARCPRAEWLVALDERVQRLGQGPPPADIKQRVDMQGRTIVPGFVDAHTHFFQTGLDKLFVDLGGATTLGSVLEKLQKAPGGPRTWLFAHSYEEDKLTDVDVVTCADLDPLFPERPIWINRIDYHSAVVNTAALRRLGLAPGTPGLLVTSAGKPDGRLRSEAYLQAKAQVSRMYPIDTKNRAVKTAATACIANGITALHALEGGRIFGDEGVTTVLKRAHLLPLDLTLFLQEKNVHFTTRFGFEHLGGCILIDGSIGSYTAALEDDYVGLPGERGTLYEKRRELTAFVEEAHTAGVQLAFHAIGPRAIELVLDAYERALRKVPRYDHRHRIEHFELATDEQIRRAADLGVVVSMQPSFEHFWGGPSGMYASRLGERWRRTNRLRTILDAGLVIAGGSDTNVTPAIPLLGIHAAVNHPNDEERVTVEEALRMMTLDAAYSGFNERRHGSLSPGKDASFVVLDRDLFAVPKERIREIRVLETWFRGRCSYRDGTARLGDDDDAL